MYIYIYIHMYIYIHIYVYIYICVHSFLNPHVIDKCRVEHMLCVVAFESVPNIYFSEACV